MLSSYCHILTLEHRYLENLLNGEIVIEEKIDGSQLSFGRQGDILSFRSKRTEIFPGNDVQKLFKDAVDYIVSIKDKLEDGYTYRGEVLHAPRHNTLTYGRVPKHNVVLFDIETSEGQHFMSPEGMILEAMKLDLETVPVFFKGKITDVQGLKSLLEEDSFLGECKLEGIVIKNYNQFGKDGKVLMGKWARGEFKEIHKGAWKEANPSKNDIIETFVKVYGTEQRWEKAVQHLRDEGRLEGAPQDIGLLMKEVQEDLLKECEAEIKEKLFEYAFPKIARGSASGLPYWYKAKLLNNQFPAKEVLNEQST